MLFLLEVCVKCTIDLNRVVLLLEQTPETVSIKSVAYMILSETRAHSLGNPRSDSEFIVQIFLLSALLIACEELVLWFFEVMCLALPDVLFILLRFVILPVELLAPRCFCLPFELLVVVVRLACCLDPVAELG